MDFGCGYASRREVALITHIGKNSGQQTYSDDLKNVVEFADACPDDLDRFDFVRVTLLDLKAAGLVECCVNGWKLTDEGWKAYTTLMDMEDDVPF